MDSQKTNLNDKNAEQLIKILLNEISFADLVKGKPLWIAVLLFINLAGAIIAVTSIYHSGLANDIQRGGATSVMLTTFSDKETLDGFLAIEEATRIIPQERADYITFRNRVYNVRRKLEAFALCAKLNACDNDTTEDFICKPIVSLENAFSKAATAVGETYNKPEGYHGYLSKCRRKLKL